MHCLKLRARIDILKEKINNEIDKYKGALQEEIILELSKELDELICDYIKAYK